MAVHVVIPVHNNVEMTLACLAALSSQVGADCRIVVVDDGSTDGTGEAIARDFPEVTVLSGDGKLWWTGAMAMGVDHVSPLANDGDFVLCMNNDISFAPDYVATLVAASITNGRALVASFCRKQGDASVIIDQGCRIDWRTTRRLTSLDLLRDELRLRSLPADDLAAVTDEMLDDIGELRRLDWLYGRGSLVPVEVFARAGNFDARRFPHYGGDTEFFYRAGQAGFELVISLRARVANIESQQTTGVHYRQGRLSWPEAWAVLTSQRSAYQLAKGLRFIKCCCPRRYRMRNKLRVIRTSLAMSFGRTRLGMWLRRRLGRGEESCSRSLTKGAGAGATRRVFLYHGEAYGNLGDEAMLLCASERIRQRIKGVEFVTHRRGDDPMPDIQPVITVDAVSEVTVKMARLLVPLGFVRRQLAKWRVNPLPLVIQWIVTRWGGCGAWRRLARELRSCEAVYFVGAANLNDLAEYSCVLPKMIVAELAHRRGIPVIASAQTAGPLRLPWVRKMVRRLIARCSHFSIRDGGVTWRELQLSDEQQQSLPIVGDEAMVLPPAPVDAVRQFLVANGVQPDKPFGVVHFRSTDYACGTDRHYEKLARGLDAVDTVEQIVFLPMSCYLQDDHKCGLSIQRLMKHPDRLKVVTCPEDASMARGVVGQARWVLSLSYHLQVFALAAGRPFGILTSGPYYNLKGQGMLALLEGQVDLCDLDEGSSADLARAMQRLDAAERQLSRHIAVVRDRVMDKNSLPVDALARALGG